MQSKFSKTKRLLEYGYQEGCFERGIIGVGIGNQILMTYGLGADENTLFDMASMTKIMATTMVALKFLEEGKLALTDTIDNYLEVPKDKKAITIQHLMTHTAGFIPFYDLVAEAGAREHVIPHILAKPLETEIGGNVYYSCIGYIVLGKILEVIEGKSLDQLAEIYVFEPLNLESTGYKPVGENIAPTEFDVTYQAHLKGVVHDENARLVGASGNAGVFSSLKDTMRFAAMLSNKGEVEGISYLNERTLKKAIKNYTPACNEARGLGFSLYDGSMHASGDLFEEGSFGHTGFTGTSMFVDKTTGLYVVILTNRVFGGREGTAFFRLRRRLHNVVISEFLGSKE